MASEKQIHLQTFDGGLNTTDARELIKSNQYFYSLNINTMSTGNGDVGIVTNLKGNVLIPKTLPSGRCRTLGYARDEEKNKLYEFVWNINGYHTIYQFDGLTNQSIVVMQSITDTGGIDIFGWTEFELILMTDVVRNALLYWVKSGNKAAKINVNKALDKSPTGYGIITEEFVNAYKLAPIVAPTMEYYSDTTVPVNRLYGTLIKTAVRHIFDDFEQSNYSDYSDAVVPPKEAFSGVNTIPTDNNAIKITVPTGSAIVKKIEIVFQYTVDGGFSKWRRIAVLDKDELSIGDNSTYTYTFYNSDGEYPVVDQEKIIRPYSYLPLKPLCQAFTQNAMVYANFNAGFEDVDVDMNFEEPIYEDLFLDDSITNEFNDPQILVEVNTANDRYNKLPTVITKSDGTTTTMSGIRTRKFKLTIGDDVKAGNIFNLRFQNGYPPDTFVLSYTAKNTDTPTSVANKLKQMIINTGRVLLSVQASSPVSANIFTNTDVGGNISYEFILFSSPKLYQYLEPSYSVNPVQFDTLKDTGVSISNQKMGDSVKYGIVYEDDDTRRTLTYTSTDLIVKIDSQNEQGGLKKVTLILNINHKPPIWAKKYQIVRTDSLVYDFNSLIQMVVQKVIDVPLTDQITGDYVDLLIGSLYTYQKIHSNTTLKYEFKKGDRIRFISNEDGSYYPFFETEVLSYQDTVTSVIEQNAKIVGTDSVEVGETSAENIGSYIIIDGSERLIIDAPDSTHYQVNYPIGEASASSTFLEYTIVNRRGSIRIRKPSTALEDVSLVEIFTPNSSSEDEKQFYHFNKKFDIINYGLETRQHFGDLQVQTNSQPAKVSITEGTIYVRSREMPITNELPAQVVIRSIEDPSYSDFYFSRINSNGKPNAEDNGSGVVHFSSRFVFSNNYVEDTKINGLNDFDNLDRRDYYDKYGDVMLIVFTESKMLVFKQQKDCFIYVNQTIIRDNADTELLGTSSKLLNELGYYAHQGGIGNNPESYFSYGNRHYHASVNSGVFCRLSTDGITPISEIFQFDNVAGEILRSAGNNSAFIYGGFDIPNNVAVWAIPSHPEYTMNSDFNQAQWKTLDDEREDTDTIEILTQPVHGVATLDGEFADVTNDGTVTSDFFTYRVLVDGVWINRKVCLTYVEPSNRQTAWRQKDSSGYCVTEDGLRTGYYGWVTLEQYYLDDNSLTGNEKVNEITDPDYVMPIYDDLACVPEEPVVYYPVTDEYGIDGDSSEDSCVVVTELEDLYTTNPSGIVGVGDWFYKDDGMGGKEVFYTTPFPIGTDISFYWISLFEGANKVWFRLAYDSGVYPTSGDLVMEKGICGYNLIATQYAVGEDFAATCPLALTTQPNAIYTSNPTAVMNIGDILYIDGGALAPYIPLGMDDIVSYMEGMTRVWIQVDVDGTVLDKGNC